MPIWVLAGTVPNFEIFSQSAWEEGSKANVIKVSCDYSEVPSKNMSHTLRKMHVVEDV